MKDEASLVVQGSSGRTVGPPGRNVANPLRGVSTSAPFVLLSPAQAGSACRSPLACGRLLGIERRTGRTAVWDACHDRGVSTVYDTSRPDGRQAGLATAANAVRAGGLVVLPTDTVYGIGADAFDPSAVAALLSAKGRGRDMPVPVLVGSWSTVDGLVRSVPKQARSLIEAFWPGGLSIVLPQAPSLTWDLGNTRGTVNLRMPLHPVALDLLREVGPMAVSSANSSGNSPAITADDARQQLGEAVSVYLDGGPCGEPVASTIVDFTQAQPRVLREGAVGLAELSEVMGIELAATHAE